MHDERHATRLTIGSRLQWKAGRVLLRKVSCYIMQLDSNTRTLGPMKTAFLFWVGQQGSSAAQGSFAATRQTLRHVGESNLIWFLVFLNSCLDTICDMTSHVTNVMLRIVTSHKWGYYASPSWRGWSEVLYRANRLPCFGFVSFILCRSQELFLLRACSVMYVCCILPFHCSWWARILCCKHCIVSYVTCLAIRIFVPVNAVCDVFKVGFMLYVMKGWIV